MKKLLAILLTASLLAACQTNSNARQEDAAAGENSNAKNSYHIDRPYAMQSYYDETATPEVYSIVATRAVNRMLDQTRPIYENLGATFLYIMEPKTSKETESGFYLSQMVAKKMIEGSKTYTIVNSMNEADYYLETLITKISIEGSDSPIIQYKLMMFDKKDRKVNEWIENIRQVSNDDRSWL
ncbi:MAG: hypothetical protein LBR70_05855 [Lactobacillaceae bacterium]|nr:hypothetical protein [Lactobacillaceae bacterium]